MSDDSDHEWLDSLCRAPPAPLPVDEMSDDEWLQTLCRAGRQGGEACPPERQDGVACPPTNDEQSASFATGGRLLALSPAPTAASPDRGDMEARLSAGQRTTPADYLEYCGEDEAMLRGNSENLAALGSRGPIFTEHMVTLIWRTFASCCSNLATLSAQLAERAQGCPERPWALYF